MKNDRLANAVLYLLRKCPDAGMTKLLKLLYYTDYHHYRDHLATVTGAEYVALKRGPAVDGYEEEFAAMERRGLLATREVKVLGHTKPKVEYLLLVEADTEAFTKAELATLEHVVMKYGDMSGVDLSEMSHEEALPWSYAYDPDNPGTPIPHALFRWLDNMASERDVEKAKDRARAPG